MGFIVPFLPAIFSAVAGAAGSKLASRSRKSQDSGAPPSPPVTPPTAADALKTAIPASITAAVQQRKKAQGAPGRQSTILTGPSGLGNIGPANVEHKTILGYAFIFGIISWLMHTGI